jgi:hypothetical protein
MPTEWQPFVGEVMRTSANRGFHVVSVTDSYDRILGFLDQKLNSLSKLKCNLISHAIYFRCNLSSLSILNFTNKHNAMSKSLHFIHLRSKLFLRTKINDIHPSLKAMSHTYISQLSKLFCMYIYIRPVYGFLSLLAIFIQHNMASDGTYAIGKDVEWSRI